MDRLIVLDVNLGFGNDYDSLSASGSNTILSFLNKKINARNLKKQPQAEQTPVQNEVSEIAVVSERTVPVPRSEESATALNACISGSNNNSKTDEDIVVNSISQFDLNSQQLLSKRESTNQKIQSAKFEPSLLSAVSTSDDEETMISNAIRKSSNKSSKAKKSTATTPNSKFAAHPNPTFRFLNYRVTSENWVMYSIQIQDGLGGKWKFESRYSLLKVFEEKLLEETEGQKLEFPEFPAKQWFGNLTDGFIKDRMTSIERFMNSAFRSAIVQKSRIFKEFMKQSKENAIDF